MHLTTFELLFTIVFWAVAAWIFWEETRPERERPSPWLAQQYADIEARFEAK